MEAAAEQLSSLSARDLQQALLLSTRDGATVLAEAALFNFPPQLLMLLGEVSAFSNQLNKIYI